MWLYQCQFGRNVVTVSNDGLLALVELLDQGLQGHVSPAINDLLLCGARSRPYALVAGTCSLSYRKIGQIFRTMSHSKDRAIPAGELLKKKGLDQTSNSPYPITIGASYTNMEPLGAKSLQRMKKNNDRH
jgi:hypothetical protein